MASSEPPRVCFECGKAVETGQQFLVFGTSAGKERYVHTLCFNDQTFDPEQYSGSLNEPDTDG